MLYAILIGRMGSVEEDEEEDIRYSGRIFVVLVGKV